LSSIGSALLLARLETLDDFEDRKKSKDEHVTTPQYKIDYILSTPLAQRREQNFYAGGVSIAPASASPARSAVCGMGGVASPDGPPPPFCMIT
jgi:hypothetical protein